jgi:hypothetical protein
MSYNDYRDKLYETDGFYIPDYMMDGVIRYIEDGVEPGGFLSAVLVNDLTGAVAHADDVNMRNLPAYVRFFYNHCPSACWGNRDKVTAWIVNGGLNGIQKMESES